MDHIGAILSADNDVQQQEEEPIETMADGFPKLKRILQMLARAVAELTCKKSLADGRFGLNRFHGVISFQSNKFLVQFVNESSMGFETLVRVYDYTYNKDQLFVTKFRNPNLFAECIQEQEGIFTHDDMVRWRWEIRNVCKCCDMTQILTEIEHLATELDRIIVRNKQKSFITV